jgi:hypothetical protein
MARDNPYGAVTVVVHRPVWREGGRSEQESHPSHSRQHRGQRLPRAAGAHASAGCSLRRMPKSLAACLSDSTMRQGLTRSCARQDLSENQISLLDSAIGHCSALTCVGPARAILLARSGLWDTAPGVIFTPRHFYFVGGCQWDRVAQCVTYVNMPCTPLYKHLCPLAAVEWGHPHSRNPQSGLL